MKRQLLGFNMIYPPILDPLQDLQALLDMYVEVPECHSEAM